MLRRLLWRGFIASRGVNRHHELLDRFQSMHPEEARLHMAARLQTQIRYFGLRSDALPEWREAARITDPLELWQCWPQLPILTKSILQQRFPAEEMRARFKLTGQVSSTGGSTGEPVSYVHDGRMIDALTATGLYGRMRMGWRPGMPTISVWGSERDIGRQRSLARRFSNVLKNDYLVDGYELGPHTVDRVIALLKRHRPVAMFGFTSMLEYVARECLKRSSAVPQNSVEVAWNGGEMLYKNQSEVFHRAFGTPILNFYGSREFGTLAHQLTAERPLDVLRPYNFLEIVTAGGRPAGPGETGRLVWTSTCCRGTPFLRYDIGDLGMYAGRDRDVSGIKAISELQGRTAGLLQLPGGKTINCLYWNHALKDFPEVHQFQVVLRGTGGIELRLRGDGFTHEREYTLRSVLRHLLCEMPVEIRWMERIPLSPQGKLVQVVRS